MIFDRGTRVYKCNFNFLVKNGQIVPYKCDMTNTDEVLAMFKYIESNPDLGQIDVCICNAGLALGKPLSQLTPEEMSKMINLNVIAVSYATQLSVNLMLRKKVVDGQIIFINR